MTTLAPSPLDTLLPFQRPTFDDRARFVIGLWSRQTGKSHVGTLMAVTDCLTHPGALWVILSAGERQALESMLKCRQHIEAWGITLSGYHETRDSAEAVLRVAEARFPNGSRILAVPANPDTARGYSANLLLDEFAFHEQPDAIWRAIYPSISNPLKGQKRVVIMSTPNGRGNKFADLWFSVDQGWSKHKVTIHDAVAGGLPLDVDELRRGLNDPEGWAQEYECEFIDSAAILLPYDLIAKCESLEATTNISPEWWAGTHGALYCGIDFGRKHDLTVCWTVEMLGDVAHTREVLELRNTDTAAQLEILRPRIQAAQRTAFDYTGAGVGLGDLMAGEFGTYDPAKHTYGRIDLVTFTNAAKVDVFSKLRMDFDAIKVRVPSDRAIREDLHSIHRVSLTGGGVTYRAPHTPDGHADRCTALALAIRASANAATSYSATLV